MDLGALGGDILSGVEGLSDEKDKDAFMERLRRKWREEFMYKKAKFEITFSFPGLPVRFVRRNKD